jgi:hypothetical protein
MSEQAVLIPNTLSPSPYEIALLPWEDAETFARLREDYFETYPPGGPAERHILEQLIWCDWRRRRLLLGERALHLAALHQRSDNNGNDAITQRANVMFGGRAEISSRQALRTQPEEDGAALEEARADTAMTQAAISILDANGPDAYAQALAALRDDTREWWETEMEEDERYKPEAESLLGFLLVKGRPNVERTEADMALRPHIRLQAWGESLDPQRMDRLMLLDERLVRQYEKLIGMLERARRSKAPRLALSAAHPVR